MVWVCTGSLTEHAIPMSQFLRRLLHPTRLPIVRSYCVKSLYVDSSLRSRVTGVSTRYLSSGSSPASGSPARAAMDKNSAIVASDELIALTSPSEVKARMPTADECSRTIAAMIDFGLNPMKLVANIAAQHVFIPMNSQLASTCLNAATVCRDIKGIVAVAEALTRLQVVPDLSTCERAVATASAMGEHALAVKLFELMIQSQLDAPHIACMHAAVSYVLVGRTDTAIALVRNMASANSVLLTPDFFKKYD